MATSAAFFDLDNTVIRGSSLYLLARGLKRYGFITDEDIRQFLWKQLKFVAGGREYLGDMEFIRNAALRLAAGHKISHLEELADDVVQDYLIPKVYAQTVELAKAHLERGEEVWLVTATPRRLATIVALKLGFTGAIGTEAEIVDGELTGELAGPIMHGAVKAEAVAALAAERGWNLADCSAYSDSSNDIPMLSCVGHAFVVNPDRKLRTTARKRQWRCYDFRKLRHARKYSVHALVVAIVTAFASLLGRKRPD